MPLFTATKFQICTYLLGVCPFSIAFLVFLNSSVSFVITDLIVRDTSVGDAVGNLGLGDELVAIVFCPFWGLLSDRIGVRMVCVMAYAIIFLALIVFVQAKNVYPQLLLARLFFSIGGAAATTMVTAVLPTMVYTDLTQNVEPAPRSVALNRHIHAPSVASELTITPARFQSSTRHSTKPQLPGPTAIERSKSTSKISGFVGMFTGCGALLALLVFLPLPAFFQGRGLSPGKSIQHAYYIVSIVAITLSIFCFWGLRNLKSDTAKGWKYLVKGSSTTDKRIQLRTAAKETSSNLYQALLAGFRHTDIGIGYVGGFVARASSVGISTFIPLLVNAAFATSGICTPAPGEGTPHGLPEIKRRCPQAYILAAMLAGVAETMALVAAPVFGYWSARTSKKTLPLGVSAIAGIIGYPLFAACFDADASKKGDRAGAYIAACFIGFSQIGAIVCSLASIGTGVLLDTHMDQPTQISSDRNQDEHRTLLGSDDFEAQPLINERQQITPLSDIKGSIAGVYSFLGGIAILILAKAGGALFDSLSTGAPFYIMAIFNGLLLIASIILAVREHQLSKSK